MNKVGSLDISGVDVTTKLLENKAQGSNYIGAGDDMLDFGKSSSFIQEDKTGYSFQIILKNTHATAAKTVEISKGLVAADGAIALKDGTTDSVQIAGHPQKSEMLSALLEMSVVRINQIRVKTDDEAQFDEALRYAKQTPYGIGAEELRIPATYQNASDNKNVVIISDVQDWILGGDRKLSYTVRAGRSVTLTFIMGGAINLASALETKANNAKENIALAYARTARK